MKRGRPPVIDPVQAEPPRKFTREYKDYTGHRSVWTYNLDINPFGPIMVEEFYPKGSTQEPDETDESIPKTKRKYVNPKNGKLVAYTRAKELGLID
jgi:hypothetical protein